MSSWVGKILCNTPTHVLYSRSFVAWLPLHSVFLLNKKTNMSQQTAHVIFCYRPIWSHIKERKNCLPLTEKGLGTPALNWLKYLILIIFTWNIWRQNLALTPHPPHYLLLLIRSRPHERSLEVWLGKLFFRLGLNGLVFTFSISPGQVIVNNFCNFSFRSIIKVYLILQGLSEINYFMVYLTRTQKMLCSQDLFHIKVQMIFCTKQLKCIKTPLP